MTLIKTTDRPIRYVLERPDSQPRMEALGAGDYMATSLPVRYAETENELLGQLDSETAAFPPLPDSGWLEQDAIYQHNGQAVIVRQSHNRTEHDPADVPALFLVHREDASQGVEWIAGEQVYVGTERTYEGSTYRCLQAHVTQSDWTPDATPALWAVVAEDPEPTDEWQVGVSYATGDVVTYKGIQYECRQAHTSQAGWEPPNVLALWLPS